MKRFQFRLESVLNWRERQSDLEEAKLQALFEELHALGSALERNAADRAQAERAVFGARQIDPAELAALDPHREWLARDRRRIEERRRNCEQRIEAQRIQLMEAERKVRLLERLRGRRRQEWQAEADRELEQTAAESFLARWSREMARPR